MLTYTNMHSHAVNTRCLDQRGHTWNAMLTRSRNQSSMTVWINWSTSALIGQNERRLWFWTNNVQPAGWLWPVSSTVPPTLTSALRTNWRGPSPFCPSQRATTARHTMLGLGEELKVCTCWTAQDVLLHLRMAKCWSDGVQVWEHLIGWGLCTAPT